MDSYVKLIILFFVTHIFNLKSRIFSNDAMTFTRKLQILKYLSLSTYMYKTSLYCLFYEQKLFPLSISNKVVRLIFSSANFAARKNISNTSCWRHFERK